MFQKSFVLKFEYYICGKNKLLKHTILTTLFFFLISWVGAQNFEIRVVDANSSDPVAAVYVVANGQDYFTNDAGVVVLDNVKEPLNLSVSKAGYNSQTFVVNDLKGMNFYTIRFVPASASNVIILDESQLQEEETSTSVSSLLGASRDPFLASAAFNFGAVRFRVRGYENNLSETMINNLPMATLHNGRVPFNFWGGLNDVFRNNTTTLGLDHSDFTYGNLNGANNIDISAGSQRKQTRLSYAISNRTYRNRLMGTYSTGEMKNGWAFTVSGSRRWANEGYIPGTFYDGWSYFAGAEKKFNDRHSLSVSFFGSPIHRGSGSGSLVEMYELANSNYYNPNWGYIDGEKKSARNWKTHAPVLSINHTAKFSDRLSLNHSFGIISGRSGQSRIDWYNAPDPRPDYYRYLPSFYGENTDAVNAVADYLASSEEARQIDWQRLFEVNKNNFETLTDVNGNGEVVEGLRSLYAIKEDRQDLTRTMYSGYIQYELSQVSQLNGGITAQYERTHFFQSLDNLLGGEYWYDVNQFVERFFPNDPDKIQADLNNPNRVVREGDIYGYNYTSNITDIDVWGAYNLTLRNIDFHVAAQLNYNALFRNGIYKNGAFPDNSEGKSETVSFLSPALKTGITYKINGRNYIYGNASYQEFAPNFRNTFISPRFRNTVVEEATTQKALSGEAAYVHRSPILKLKALGYYTRFRDITEVNSFFIDGTSNAFVNFISTGEGRTHVGTEFSSELKLSTTLSVKMAAGVGQNYIDVRPVVDIVQDNTGDILFEDETIYVKNFRLQGAQSAYTLGLNYNSPKYWYVNVNFNYFDHIYLDYNPLRRTVGAVEGIERGSDFYYEILAQERLDPGFTLDFFGGGSKKIGDHFIYLNVGVNNILNNQNLRTGGFEQTRLATVDNSNAVEDLGRFPSRYFFAFGRNYFINLSYRF